MAFTPIIKNTGDLVTTQDWNDAMQAISEAIAALDQSAGHRHTGAVDDGPQLGTASLVNGVINSAKLANGSVTTSKVRDRAITADKLASGLLGGEIGVAVTPGLSDGQSIPVPAGFSRSECIFYAAIKYINIDGRQNGPTNLYYCSIENNGRIRSSPSGRITAMGMAIGKRGGW